MEVLGYIMTGIIQIGIVILVFMVILPWILGHVQDWLYSRRVRKWRDD